jgi:hypothetical protein
MKKLSSLLGLALVALAVAAVAVAHPHKAKNFTAKLTGAQEVPAVTTEAKGQAQFHVKRKNGVLTLRYNVGVRKIDNVVGAHIHCAPRGVNGPIVVTLHPRAGSQVNTTADSFRVRGEATALDGPSFTCATRNGGTVTVTTLQQLIRLMNRGLTYVNVHTSPGFPGGEVRGQIRSHGHGRK